MQIPKRKSENYIRPKFDPHITEDKFNELKEKMEKLKKSHPRAAEEVKRLAKMGDFSENFAYQAAKGHLRGINQRILEIEDQLNRAVIIKPDKELCAVQIGCNVTIETNGKQSTYVILGSAETNPSLGIISHNSPLGSALLGRKVGDVINLKLADREVEYKIMEIK